MMFVKHVVVQLVCSCTVSLRLMIAMTCYDIVERGNSNISLTWIKAYLYFLDEGSALPLQRGQSSTHCVHAFKSKILVGRTLPNWSVRLSKRVVMVLSARSCKAIVFSATDFWRGRTIAKSLDMHGALRGIWFLLSPELRPPTSCSHPAPPRRSKAKPVQNPWWK